jgi:very-short-patch-repair endonuclease
MKPVERAREMRKALTPPEARLWAGLKRLRAEGFHFRRQAPFRGYFLDFVCHGRRLVIEVDGRSHAARSGMRFWNGRATGRSAIPTRPSATTSRA